VTFVPLVRERAAPVQEEAKKEVELQLAASVRNHLTGGALLKKHSNTAEPRVRQIYVTPDLQYFIWKDPKKPVKPDSKMKV
jgi:hypothetical protein